MQGLTTAASLWTASAIGCASGFGFFALASVGTVVSLLILAGARRLERHGPEANEPDAKP